MKLETRLRAFGFALIGATLVAARPMGTLTLL